MLRAILSKEMVRAIMGMISQLSFLVHIGKSNSQGRNLLNGVPQSSAFAPALLYTCDIHVDDIVMIAPGECFKVV